MRGVKPPPDFIRPTKRPKFSDVPLGSSLPTARQLAQIEDSGGDITLKSNATLTMRFIGKPRKHPRIYTQGTLFFYDNLSEDYLSLHEVNLRLREETPPGVESETFGELVFFQVQRRFRYIGVFRNAMPGNDSQRYRNLLSRQPLMGVDVTGRTNIMDLFERGQTADTVHLGLFLVNINSQTRLQFIPMMNWGRKVSKNVQGVLGELHPNAFARCVWDGCLGLINIGTVVRTPSHKILRNRDIAWHAENETKAQAMNLLEIIMV